MLGDDLWALAHTKTPLYVWLFLFQRWDIGFFISRQDLVSRTARAAGIKETLSHHHNPGGVDQLIWRAFLTGASPPDRRRYIGLSQRCHHRLTCRLFYQCGSTTLEELSAARVVVVARIPGLHSARWIKCLAIIRI